MDMISAARKARMGVRNRHPLDVAGLDAKRVELRLSRNSSFSSEKEKHTQVCNCRFVSNLLTITNKKKST